MAATTLLRAALPSIPVVNQLPGVRKTGADPSSLHEVRFATVTRAHVTSYAAVCGFPVKDVVPLTFPHVLAFPLHMAVMSSPDFPFPAIGTVHLANSITRHRPVEIGETLQLEVHTSAVQPHPKGRAIDFLARATADGETVWESTSTYLRRGRDNPDADAPGGPDHVVPGRVTWRLGSDVGRRYAAVSGDHNPIHLYRLTAKAFGFPRQIVHGMWSKARCLAALEGRLPEAYTVDVGFKVPVPLPSTVAFTAASAGGGWRFGLHAARSGKPHLTGEVIHRS